MSTDYYSRFERERGPQPSVQMLAAMAHGLHLSRDERDHLFRLAGHQAPARGAGTDHISPGVLRIFDRLTDTPAEIVTELGETLRQTPLGVALVGDLTSYRGPSRSLIVRWFTDPQTRRRYLAEDHDFYSRLYTSGLRGVLAQRGPDSTAARYVDLLTAASAEFRAVWAQHEVGLRPREVKRYQHPLVGLIELSCQILLDPEQSHVLLVYTAAPGSESREKLELLSVVGSIEVTEALKAREATSARHPLAAEPCDAWAALGATVSSPGES